MERKPFNPDKYGMVVCSLCSSHGYIEDPKRQCCPKCGGFGYIIKDVEKNPKVPPNIYSMTEKLQRKTRF